MRGEGRWRRWGWTIGVVAALFALLALPARGARDDLDLVSRATGGTPADGPSMDPAISSDGRFVAFSSEADNLSAEDVDGVRDVFVRDLATGVTTLVSRADGPGGAGGDGSSSRPSISADGRLVAFSSFAHNLSAEDEEAFEDVFVRDMTLATTTLVSRASGPAGAPADRASFAGVISANGARVAFVSGAVNLSGVDDPASQDVFVRDLAAATTTLASRADGPDGTQADGNSLSPALSADGRHVAFSSLATSLSTQDDDDVRDVFVRDLAAGATALVSRAAGASGAAGDGDSFGPSLSGDGRFVAFSSRADNLSVEDDSPEDVYVRDLAVNATVLVSRASGGGGAAGDSDSFSPRISVSGSRVAFASEARNLSAEDADPVTDVLVRDLATGLTTLASRAAGPAGAAADSNAFAPAISADGRYVAFYSAADALSGEDLDAFANVFRRDVQGVVAPDASTVLGGSGAAKGALVRCNGIRAGIVGTARRDVIRGTPRRDVIAALGGNDLVVGRGGGDLVCLGTGNDRGLGGAGADRILGGSGADRLEGGDGPDRLEGGPGRDRLVGGAGRDRLLGRGGRDTGRGGPGADLCRLESARAC